MQEVRCWDDHSELPRPGDRLFARGYSGCCLLHPERNGETHGGLNGSEESYHRLPALRNPASLACERRAWFARSSKTRSLPRSLLHTCFRGLFESRKTWSIYSSISARGDWRGFCCCLGKIIKESKPEYPLKLSQSTLAEMVGTTRARLRKF